MFYKLNKERGISSFKCIKTFAKENKIEKIGHSGTLDPLADGLLIVATEEDTKLLSLISASDKTYEVSATFHKSSPSFDEGEEITLLQNKKNITKDNLLKALAYIKDIKEQIPPKFSAKLINGVRSYRLARDNKEVNLKPQKIEIKSIELLDFNEKNQIFSIRTCVSKGTYVRTLMHDIAAFLGTDCVVNKLTRIKIGNIELSPNKKNEAITNLSQLFELKLYSLKVEEISWLFKNQSKTIFIENLKTENGEKIFIFENVIIGFGNIFNGNLSFTKIFFPRMEKILKEKQND
ncbi:tRNA pseudouridine55 synthase [Metamycoplasma subdolum]|uniref:tRNA pseudouridine(55) synthase n=1 Tax=Metamycoplasma subdolum TaxID=92407 RepID=A0A3L9ZYR4_9BACT|nr:tRNA pseudouridine(55) synthase [Metamycoplasma subdolum]RMA77517.1 tRNA pseudouridine55 synthase [Metamycoplasma subdolum]WPB50709.1 tRNA pseudouridine(55) synthase [Metamycoplasma subdolum]